MLYLGVQKGVFSKALLGSETSERLGGMYEGASVDICCGKFPLMSMGGRAEGLACADPGARTPIGMSGNFFPILLDTFVQDRDFFWLES